MINADNDELYFFNNFKKAEKTFVINFTSKIQSNDYIIIVIVFFNIIAILLKKKTTTHF